MPKITVSPLTSALCTALITLSASWAVMANGRVTQGEVREMIDTTGPYVQDRQSILDAINRANADIGRILAALDTMGEKQSEALAELRALRAELEALQRDLDRRP